MFPRLFRRIKTKKGAFIRACGALILFTATLFGQVVPALAQTSGGQTTQLTELNARYANYLGLFAPNSSIKYVGPKQAATNGVQGLIFRLDLNFNVTDHNAEWHWAHVTNSISDSSDVFVIKLCEASGTQCWLQTVPLSDKQTYRAIGSGSTAFGTAATDIMTGTDSAAYRQGSNGYINTQGFGFNGFSSAVSTYSYDIANDTVTPASNVAFGSGSSYTADLWYCAGNTKYETFNGTEAAKAYTNLGLSNDSVRTFGAGANSQKSLCSGTTYFKIASTNDPVLIPADAATIQQQVTSGASALAAGRTQNDTPTDLPSCSLTSVWWCFAHLVYYLIYKPIEWVTGIFGRLFDFFLGYSLSSSSYEANFITVGWKLVRDVSNIFFIIILVWAGFSAVFSLDGTGSIKKVLPTLIINALLINFSLFGVRLGIDLSNVTARLFYNAMEVCTGPCTGTNFDRHFGYWALSEKIVSSFNPQDIFNPSVLNGLNASKITSNTLGTGEQNGSVAGTQAVDMSSASYAGYYIVVSLIAAAIMFAILLMFWKVAFIFLGRTIGLYIVMIFSPFALLSRGNLPLVGNIPQLSWKDWVKELSQYLSLAPMFVFFLYIIYSIVSSDFIKNVVPNATGDQTGSFFETVLRIAIPMLIVYFLVDQAAKIAKDYSGKIGSQVSGFAEKLSATGVGLAAGVATGGTALLGSRVLGGAAARLDESKFGRGIRDMAGSGGVTGFIGKNLQRGLNAARGGSYDLREGPGGKTFFDKLKANTGIDAGGQRGLDALAGVGIGLSAAQRKGGRDADIKRRAESKENDAKLFEEKMSDDQIKEVNAARKKQEEEINAPINARNDAAIEAEMVRKWGQGTVDMWKQNPNQDAFNEYRDKVKFDPNFQQNLEQTVSVERLKSADEMTNTRRKKFADNLKKPSKIDAFLNKKAVRYASFGTSAAFGSAIRTTADKKAAKKIEEKTKAQKNLDELKELEKKGMQNLVTIDKFGTAQFQNLSTKEKDEILEHGQVIDENSSNKGKTLYDFLDDGQKSQVDSMMNGMDDDNRKVWEARVQAVEQGRYEMREVNKDVKTAREKLKGTPTPDDIKAFNKALRAQEHAKSHNDKWRDINKYREDQKKKLKDEEKK